MGGLGAHVLIAGRDVAKLATAHQELTDAGIDSSFGVCDIREPDQVEHLVAGLLAARSISLIAGTAAIAAMYATARLGRVPALLAAVLLALSFPLIDYSQ